MPLTKLAWYLVVLAFAVAADILISRWRRQVWRPEHASNRVERLVLWVDGQFGRGLQWFNARLPKFDLARPSLATVGNLFAASSTAPKAAGAVKVNGPVPTAIEALPKTVMPPSPPPPTAVASVAPDETSSSVSAPVPSAAPLNSIVTVDQPSSTVSTSVVEFPVQVESATVERPGEGLARVNISVEMPVGAIVRFTIETGAGARPTITQVSMPPQPVLSAPPLAMPAPAPISLPAPAGLKSSTAAPGAPVRAPRPAGVPGLRRVGQWASALRVPWQRVRAATSVQVRSLPQVLFWTSVGIYMLTRLVGLDQYPIYFFTDEAAHTVLAADFVHAGLQNSSHEFLPTYFPLGPSFNLNGVSVYLQVIPYLLFGKSEFVTRATSVLVTLIAAIAVGLILRDIFKRRYWWVATLLLSVTPAWFLHSRTAFEYIEVAAYYAGFLYCYLRYRYISPRALYGVVIFGALAFYTHGLGEVLMAVATLLLGLADWRYHWQQRAVVSRALLLGLVLTLPFVRYSLAHPSSTMDELRQRGSYWVQNDLSLGSKLSQFLAEYAAAFSPAYWFQADNGRDIERHIMDSYGNLWLPTAPFLLIGLLYALRHLRESAHRAILLALAAAPVGPALVAVGMPRVLWEIIPLVILSALGLSLALEWLETRRVPALILSLGAFAVLAGFNVYLLGDALARGGVWSKDYTLAGTQYGARQVFGEAIPSYLVQHPDAQIIVSSTWANGTDMFVPFFLTPQQAEHVHLQSLDYFLSQKRDLLPNTDVVLPVYEYEKATQDPKLANIVVNKILAYPNGQPGFYFIQLGYSSQADSLFAAERDQLVRPLTETITLNGQQVSVTHPRFGAGQLRDMLDGNPFTLINAPGFNPVVLDFAFPAPTSIKGVTVITGSMSDFSVTATLDAGGNAAPQVYSQQFTGLPPDPTVKLEFDRGPSTVLRLRLEIKNNTDNGPGVNIHVREVEFR